MLGLGGQQALEGLLRGVDRMRVKKLRLWAEGFWGERGTGRGAMLGLGGEQALEGLLKDVGRGTGRGKGEI